MEKRDELFKVNRLKKDFTFDRDVAQIFDDMLERSIPFYREVIKLTALILQNLLKETPKIYDLGCSTGNTLIFLASALKDKEPELYGIDNSKHMIEKAEEKSRAYGKSIRFQIQNIEEAEIESADAIIMNYTLQFIRPLKREKLIKKIYNGLKKNGIFILSEKVVFEHPEFNRKVIDIYHNFKKEQGYSELEISRKREALENVLIPFTIGENIELMKKAGFSHISTFFQWANFVSFIAIKQHDF